MKHLVFSYLDWDRPAFPNLDKRWIEERIRIYERFTLASMLNQKNFHDFDICLLCGQRNRNITGAHFWNQFVNVFYDKGKEFISKIDDEYLAISRIDSDDLYHENALQIIADASEIAKHPTRLQGLIFRKNILWNRIYKFIGLHYRMCQPPPFVTKIYPRKIYKDWDKLSSTLFLQHGQRTWGQVPLLDLPRHYICVVKHGTNFHQVKQGLDPIEYTPEQIEKDRRKGIILATEDNEVKMILEEYGMTPELVDEIPTIFKKGDVHNGS